jgi:hypothetical protein
VPFAERGEPTLVGNGARERAEQGSTGE